MVGKHLEDGGGVQTRWDAAVAGILQYRRYFNVWGQALVSGAGE